MVHLCLSPTTGPLLKGTSPAASYSTCQCKIQQLKHSQGQTEVAKLRSSKQVAYLAIWRQAGESSTCSCWLPGIKSYSSLDLGLRHTKNCFSLGWLLGGGPYRSCCTDPSRMRTKCSLSRSAYWRSLMTYSSTSGMSHGATTLPACRRAFLRTAGEKKVNFLPLAVAA